MTMIASPPSLYVHIPFCLSRCAYCDFASGLYTKEDADAYIVALGRELAERGITPGEFSPSTLYVGGGTPSCLSLRQLADLLALLPLPPDGGEASMECNPDSINPEKLRLIREYGFTRCSFGVQTFSSAGLRLLGRRHDAERAKAAVREAAAAGFSSINLDLITAWPGQSLDCLRDDVQQAVQLGARHISCYTIMAGPGSPFSRRLRESGLVELAEEQVREYWDETAAILRESGFEHYEISNFAFPGHACRHNAAVWRGGEYHGVGAGAHSHIGGRRFANASSSAAYVHAVMHGLPREEFSEQLPPREKAKECAVFWLRLAEGICLEEFARRTGFAFRDLYRRELPDLLARKLLCETRVDGRDSIRVAPEHFPLLDAILVDLV